MHSEGKRERAAQLLAQGNLTFAQIAEDLEIAVRTLHNWRAKPDFEASVQDCRKKLEDQLWKIGIANPTRRLQDINEQWEGLKCIRNARAREPKAQEVPGGDSGLLTFSLRAFGDRVVRIPSVDGVLLAQSRALRDEARRETEGIRRRTDPAATHEDAPDLRQLSDEDFNRLRKVVADLTQQKKAA